MSKARAPPVSADPGLLRIVFLNLMVNSAHAMRGQGRIKVLVQAADGECRIAFEDSGPGIPAGDSREDLHAVLHDQVARHRPRPADGQAARSKPIAERSTSAARPAAARPSPSSCQTS